MPRILPARAGWLAGYLLSSATAVLSMSKMSGIAEVTRFQFVISGILNSLHLRVTSRLLVRLPGRLLIFDQLHDLDIHDVGAGRSGLEMAVRA